MADLEDVLYDLFGTPKSTSLQRRSTSEQLISVKSRQVVGGRPDKPMIFTAHEIDSVRGGVPVRRRRDYIPTDDEGRLVSNPDNCYVTPCCNRNIHAASMNHCSKCGKAVCDSCIRSGLCGSCRSEELVEKVVVGGVKAVGYVALVSIAAPFVLLGALLGGTDDSKKKE